MSLQKLKYNPLWLTLGVLLLVFITWSSLSPIIVKVVTVKYSDLVMHLAAYGAATFWFQQIFRGPRNVILVATSLFGYGLLMEAAQGLLTATRDANFLDVIANSTGVLLGSFLSRWFAPQGVIYWFESLLARRSEPS